MQSSAQACVGAWQLVEKIAGGGQGVVWRAVPLAREAAEPGPQTVHGPVVIEMVVVDVGDDGVTRSEREERLAILAGLDDHRRTASQQDAAVELRHVPANDRARRTAGMPEDLGQDRGGRGLAASPGDGRGFTITHHAGQTAAEAHDFEGL